MASLKAEHPELSLSSLLEASGLARSTFFYHQARLALPDPDAELKDAIRSAFSQAHGRYGHRRIHAVLMRRGWAVAKKTVLKLMRALGLFCKVRRRRPHLSWKGQVGNVAPNHLNREFSADAPNQKWVTDITEFAVGNQKVYLSPILDLFDRSIVAHAMATSPSLALTLRPLRKALQVVPTSKDLLVHSDQGVQYQSRAWQTALASVGAKQSMSRKGNCYDNSVMENFFGQLKTEMFHGTTFTSPAELTKPINDYIHWYNTERISTTRKGLSPVQYRAQTLTPRI
ncbi:IS3 family transposase [Arthrobacter woluwensis]|uniref:IS3 family transposase n=1 Tax=Arthrobacter woluwensis TaxID=156980 RepID=UPI000A7EFF01|nr:IS3 family transposase [Arthrobacter woluwensis]